MFLNQAFYQISFQLARNLKFSMMMKMNKKSKAQQSSPTSKVSRMVTSYLEIRYSALRMFSYLSAALQVVYCL
jgi:hypothetical protein